MARLNFRCFRGSDLLITSINILFVYIYEMVKMLLSFLYISMKWSKCSYKYSQKFLFVCLCCLLLPVGSKRMTTWERLNSGSFRFCCQCSVLSLHEWGTPPPPPSRTLSPPLLFFCLFVSRTIFPSVMCTVQ